MKLEGALLWFCSELWSTTFRQPAPTQSKEKEQIEDQTDKQTSRKAEETTMKQQKRDSYSLRSTGASVTKAACELCCRIIIDEGDKASARRSSRNCNKYFTPLQITDQL